MALIRTLASGYILLLFKIIFAFVSVPVLINNCGDYNYGLFILTFGISSAFSFFDFGIGVATTRSSTLFKLGRFSDSYKMNLDGNFSLNILLALLVFIITSSFCFVPGNYFNVGPEHFLTLKLLFLFGAINTFFLIVDKFAIGICYGFDDFRKRNYFQLGFQSINVLSLFFLVYFKLEIVHFALITVLITISSVASDFFLALKHLKSHKIKLHFQVTNLNFKGIEYNRGIFFLSLLSFVSTQSDKLVLSLLTNPNALLAHSIVTKPAYYVKSLSGTLYTFLQPKYVELENNIVKVERLLSDLILGSFILLFYSLIVYFFFYKDFVFLWLQSGEYSKYTFWGFIALINVLVSTILGPIFKYFVNSGQINVILKYDIFLTVFNIVVSIILTNYIGFGGVLVGTLAQLLFMLLALFMEAKKRSLHRSFYVIFKFDILCGFIITIILNYILSEATYVVPLDWYLLSFKVLSSIGLFILVFRYVGSANALKRRILK